MQMYLLDKRNKITYSKLNSTNIKLHSYLKLFGEKYLHYLTIEKTCYNHYTISVLSSSVIMTGNWALGSPPPPTQPQLHTQSYFGSHFR